MTSTTVYLISGANRGIGFGLVKSLVLRENVVIFAGARDVPGATNLQALAQEYPGKVHIVKLFSGSKEDGDAAAALVEIVAGHIDVVIANAAIASAWAPVHEISIDEMDRHFKVNAIGPLVLFQSFYKMFKSAPGTPKFVVISAAAGSIQGGPAVPMGLVAYGSSKAAVNFITRKIHFENENLISFAVHPGSVETEGAKLLVKLVPELAKFPKMPVEQSVDGILARIDEATREKTGGAFLSYKGDAFPW